MVPESVIVPTMTVESFVSTIVMGIESDSGELSPLSTPTGLDISALEVAAESESEVAAVEDVSKFMRP